MDFKTLKVKEALENPAIRALVEKEAPAVLKLPGMLINNKTIAELISFAVEKGLLPKEKAADVEKLVKDTLAKVK